MKKLLTVAAVIIVFITAQSMDAGKEPRTKVELGRLLFFDPILSANRTVSCATCHKPAFAFADTIPVSFGVGRKAGKRNTPSAMNLLLQRPFLWDGRAATLEEQALEPIKNPVEMNLPVREAVERLKSDRAYNNYFKKLFGSAPDSLLLAAAIAAFERTLETSDSPFDRWKLDEDSLAVSEQVKKGFALFNGKAKCIKCHFGSNFTTNEFRNVGLFDGKAFNDVGRAAVSGELADVGKFKTPGLRNVSVTAPYMHNGMLKTLEDVIDFYDDPSKLVPGGINRDTLLNKPLGLSKQEKKELVAFLESLTDDRFRKK